MSDVSDLTDAATRKRIGPWDPETVPPLTDFEADTNFLVRAAAGSGKTTSLVARLVALVRTGVPLEECAAITFTRKAASEMKARLHTELRQTQAQLEATSSASSRQRHRLSKALQNLPHCFIGTIHSFCSQLPREHPVAAGVPPDFTAGLDDREREEQRHRFWQSYLSNVWEHSAEQVKHVAALGIEPGELDHFFGELCRYPDLRPYVDGPETPPDLGDTVDALRKRVTRWSPALPDDPADGDAKPGTTASTLRHAQRMLAVHPMNDPAAQAEFIALFEGLTKKDRRKSTETTIRGDLTKSHWLDTDLAERLDNELLPQLEEEIVRPALHQWRAYAHNQLVEFVRPAVEQYAAHRRRTGQMTFQDLLICTRDLLRKNPGAREALQDRYPRLLVDEFQDTDPIQAEILFYLASQDPTEENWQECEPRDGSLFIVGDDKQSIYRFRRADLDVYSTVQTAIDRAPNGEDVVLESNFRSLPSLLDWCNEAFATIFDRHDAPYQAPYVPFEAARSDRSVDDLVWHLPVPYVKGSSSTRNIARRNANQIASLIAEACTSANGPGHGPLTGSAPGDFMILTRNTTRLDIFAEALAGRDLPYTMAGGNDVKRSTELYALVSLLTCVERPQDPVARVAFLRGPLVGLSDDALYRFRTSGGTFQGEFALPPGIGDSLSSELRDRLETAYEHVRDAERRLTRLRPAAALEQVIDRLGLLARARRDSGMGSLHAGRILRVLTEVQRLDAEGHSWTAIRDELQQVLDGERSLDGITLETGSKDAIRLLNVHKAKGLEAPVVFLADPYGGTHPKAPDQHVRRESGEVVLPVYEQHQYHRSLRYAPQRWNAEFQETEAQYQQAEEDRLLYVAATRAEEQLVISRYHSPSWGQEKGYWAPLYPFLENAPTLEVPTETGQFQEPDRGIPSVIRPSRIEESAMPTYETSSVTDDQTEDPLDATGTGYGAAFGTAMHRLFEHVIQRRASLSSLRPHLQNVVKVILAQHGVGEQETTALRMIDAFLDSSLWTSIERADTVHTEYPISGRSKKGPPTLTEGNIDLVYSEDGAWNLVDFKTDRPSSNGQDVTLDRYRNQLRQYAQLWESATGNPIDHSSLWLAASARQLFLSSPTSEQQT